MNLHLIDIIIILGYLLLTFSIGYFLSKKSSENLSGYFLGGNKIKWWMLGLSNSSGMFDVNAVSWRLALLLMYGVQSVWIPWVWPVWNQVFVMIFLSTWLRRSGAMTGAEWMRIRFGDGTGGKLAHIVVVVFAVVEVMISIGVFFTGIGGLVAELLPNIDINISATKMISSKTMYAIILCLLTTIYSIKGGIFSIVATEVLQFIILTICCFVVIYLGMTMVSANDVQSFIPRGWLDFWPKGEINYNWPKQYQIIESESVKNGYKMIAGMVGLMVGKGLIASIAGPVPGFDMQRSLSSQTPKDAAKMSGFTILVLFIPLYFMVGGFALLAIKQLPHSIGSMKEVGSIFNVLVQQLPVGVKGLVIAGLLAAFMSVFSAFVNVAPAYVVNDLYKRYLQKNKTDKHYVSVGKWVSFAVVIIGILIGTQIKSLNAVILFVVGAFYGAYAAPNMLKWIWWRFNGYGYFIGMMCGMIAAMNGTVVVKYITSHFIPSLNELANTQAVNLMAFVFIFVVSIVSCVLGSLLTQPVENSISKAFYAKTRPWGFWNPIIQLVKKDNHNFVENRNFKRDGINVLVGIAWQMSMVVMPLYVAFRQWNEALIGIAILVGTSLFLKFNWYDKLENE
jgi:solute:Na+ symporter, SSS family